MSDMNMGFLMRNLMNETKKKRYTQNREKHMKKLYGILPDKQITNTGNFSIPQLSDDEFKKIVSNSPHKDKDYVMKQSTVRQNLISEVTNSTAKKNQ